MGVAQKEEAGLLLLPSLPKEGVLMETEEGVVEGGRGEGRGGHASLGQKKNKTKSDNYIFIPQ